MRARRSLAGALGLALLLFFGGRAWAQPVDAVHASARISSYVDGMDTFIWSPGVKVGATVPADVELEASWKADVISSASVDVVTAATASISERRNELGVHAKREKAVAQIDLDAGYTHSSENDAYSHIFEVGAVRGFDQDNWQVGLRGTVSFNRVGLRGEPTDEWRPLAAYGADATLTRLLGPRMLAELDYSFYYLDGFQANPYRRVPIMAGVDLAGSRWVDERVPDKRLRHALTARVRRWFGPHLTGAAEYRFYLDDWGVVAQTARVDEYVTLGHGLSARLRQRATQQGGADFYQELYREETVYRTRDRRLSSHLDALVGSSIFWEISRSRLLGVISAYASGDLILFDYSQYDGPVVAITGESQMEPVGTVFAGVLQLGVEVRP